MSSTEKPYKIEKIHGGKVEYRKIQAFDACDFDGEPSNWKQGTPDGDRWLVEKRFIPNDKKEPMRFTNYWGVKP